MAPPPVRPIIIDFTIDETEKLIAEEESLNSPSEKRDMEGAPFPYTEDPRILSLPARNAVIARLRYSLIVLNTIVPILLDYSGIIPTRGVLTIGAFLFAMGAVWQYQRDAANAKIDALRATMAGDTNAIAELNHNIMRQMRYDVIGAWIGAGTWTTACLVWVAVEVTRPQADMARVAGYVIVVSGMEAILCVVLAVLLGRHRRAASQELHGHAMEFV